MPTSHMEEPTHCFNAHIKKKKTNSYEENILIIYLKYKSFESTGSLTAENISYKQLEAVVIIQIIFIWMLLY